MKALLLCNFIFALAVAGTNVFAQEQVVKPGSEEWKPLYNPPVTKPTEIPTDSSLRKELFDLLRPRVEREAKVRSVRFQGSLKTYKNWAFFAGATIDSSGRHVRFKPMENTETAGLWLRTRDGWRLVDYAVGFSDVFFMTWVDQYGCPKELFGFK